jgi:hypothetical protein
MMFTKMFDMCLSKKSELRLDSTKYSSLVGDLGIIQMESLIR